MSFPRHAMAPLSEALATFPAVVLTGARQVGKTTLLRQGFPGFGYVSLDDPATASLADHSPETFFSSHPAPLIIDEVQYSPSIFRHLKKIIDADRHAMGRFVLTGSQKFQLMKGVSDSLAGRVATMELEGFSVSELAESGFSFETSRALLEFALRGGMPELWRNPQLSRDLYFRSYMSTYIERDVRQLLNIIHLRDFERFIRACALRSGNLINKSELARDVGISPATAKEWLSVLEASNQIVLLEPWFGNLSKRLVKSPKLYFRDSGLLAHLLGVTSENVASHPALGALWETVVAAELRRTLQGSGKQASLWFYRDAQNREVDFVMENENGLTLVEVKARELAAPSDTSNLLAAEKILRQSPIWSHRSLTKVVVTTGASHAHLGEAAVIPLSRLGRTFFG